MGKIEKAMMNITSAAELMGLQEDELRDLIDNGDIQAFGSQKTLIRKSDLYKFLGEKPDENTIEREEASALSSCNKAHEGDDMKESKAQPYYNNSRKCYQMSPYIVYPDGKKRITVSGHSVEEVLAKVEEKKREAMQQRMNTLSTNVPLQVVSTNQQIQQQITPSFNNVPVQLVLMNQQLHRCKMKQLADEWFAMKKDTVKYSTLQSYFYPYQEIRDYMGDMYADEVDARTIRNYFWWKQEQSEHTYSESTYKIRRKVLYNMFEYAETYKYIREGANPMKHKIDCPKSIPADRDSRFLSKEELKELAEVLKPNLMYYTIMRLLCVTGMRIGELCALQWCDIVKSSNTEDGQHYQIKVQRALTKNSEFIPDDEAHRRYCVGETKTSTSVRSIDIRQDVYDIIMTWKEHLDGNLELVQKRIQNQTQDFVFVNKFGQVINPNSLRSTMSRYFEKRLQDMGKGEQSDSCKHKIKFHDFRHTFASLMLQNGMSLLETSRLLGHTDTSITADYYATITEQQKQKGADCISRIASEIM